MVRPKHRKNLARQNLGTNRPRIPRPLLKENTMKKKAFTLTSLLVVVTVVAILMAILTPSINEIRKHARTRRYTKEILKNAEEILTIQCTESTNTHLVELTYHHKEPNQTVRDSFEFPSSTNHGFRTIRTKLHEKNWWFKPEIISDTKTLWIGVKLNPKDPNTSYNNN